MTEEEIKLNMEAGVYAGHVVKFINGTVVIKLNEMTYLPYNIEDSQYLNQFIEKAKIDIYYCADSDEWQCDNELTKDTVDYASENTDRHTAIIDCIKHLLKHRRIP